MPTYRQWVYPKQPSYFAQAQRSGIPQLPKLGLPDRPEGDDPANTKPIFRRGVGAGARVGEATPATKRAYGAVVSQPGREYALLNDRLFIVLGGGIQTRPRPLADLMSLLDVFAKTGSAEALQLVWRLDEIFR